jgi:hypothetical protein
MTKKNEAKVVVAMGIASCVTSMIAGKAIEKKVNEKYANMRFTSPSNAALMQSIAQNELEIEANMVCTAIGVAFAIASHVIRKAGK